MRKTYFISWKARSFLQLSCLSSGWCWLRVTLGAGAAVGSRGVLPAVQQEGSRTMGETQVQSTCQINEPCSLFANNSSDHTVEQERFYLLYFLIIPPVMLRTPIILVLR